MPTVVHVNHMHSYIAYIAIIVPAYHSFYCMKPCKMKAPNCALFSVAHIVCYMLLIKYLVNFIYFALMTYWLPPAVTLLLLGVECKQQAVIFVQCRWLKKDLRGCDTAKLTWLSRYMKLHLRIGCIVTESFQRMLYFCYAWQCSQCIV